MNNQLYLMVFWMLASCGMPVSSLYQDKTVSVISAEKTEWVGGRAGVRGIMYTIKLKKKNNSILMVKTLTAEGNTVSFVQNNTGNVITIRGNLQYKNDQDADIIDHMPAGAPVENTVSQKLDPKDNWIAYTVKGSETLHKINISKFTSVERSGELVP
ncbi:hypothetical protein ACP3T3_11695 [Chryseobacterium sp. CBSDS_008]|uniref:hypothetical protein n=1 Tax=Chryseobacterium sp. CBSDS_008 TaxID=3415265 RepID=UPI003CED8357